MKEIIGYCGLDCKKCDAYIATISGDQALREKTATMGGVEQRPYSARTYQLRGVPLGRR